MPTIKAVEKAKDELYRKAIKKRQGTKGTSYSLKAMEVYNAIIAKGRGRI